MTIDPLHNIWEGLFKQLLEQWKEADGKKKRRKKKPKGGKLNEKKKGRIQPVVEEDDVEIDDTDDGADEEGLEMEEEEAEEEAKAEEMGEVEAPPPERPRKLTSKVLLSMEADVRRWKFPRSMGPMLGKIGSNMSRFTGAELKNLLNTCFYEMVDGLVDDDELELIFRLVHISRMLAEQIWTKAMVKNFASHMVDYLEMWRKMYGDASCTPNMHAATHLHQCTEDYGVVAAFWLFAFERYNGINTNGQWRAGAHLEKSMMRAYNNFNTLHGQVASEAFLASLTPEQADIARTLLACDRPGSGPADRGGGDVYNLLPRDVPAKIIAYKARVHHGYTANTWGLINGTEWFPGQFKGPGTWEVISPEAKARLLNALVALHHTDPARPKPLTSQFDLPKVGWHTYTDLHICGELYGSGLGRRQPRSYIKVAEEEEPETKTKKRVVLYRPLQVVRYVRVLVNVRCNEEEEEPAGAAGGAGDPAPKRQKREGKWFSLAEVKWFKRWPKKHPAKPHCDQFELVELPCVGTWEGMAYIPVQRIAGGFVPLTYSFPQAGNMKARECFLMGWLPDPFRF